MNLKNDYNYASGKPDISTYFETGGMDSSYNTRTADCFI